MQSKWRRPGVGLLGWLVSPSVAVGAAAAVFGAVLAMLKGLAPVFVFLIVLLFLTLGVWCANGVLRLYEFLSRRELPFELKSEVIAIQRELVRVENRRISNGGCIWPIQRPFVDLPTDVWGAQKDRLHLKREDKEKLVHAYLLTAAFNDKMLLGEHIIGSAPEQEPDLVGLRKAVDDAAGIFGVSPMSAEPRPPADAQQFLRRDDAAELAQRCHMLAGSIESWAQSFKDATSGTVEKMVEELVEAEPSIERAEARRKAYTRNEKNWELEYALRYGEEAKKLFTEAWEKDQIAKEHEQLATRPLAIQFEEVPKLFNTIAERLYGDG